MNKPKINKFWRWKTVEITNEAGEITQERSLYLNGEIASESWFEDDVTPAIFKNELMSGSGPITVWICSPGGDCIAASQIYTMLMDYPFDVTVKIDGLAASAASVVAMAGTKTLISPTGMIMIHDPSTLAYGDKQELAKAMDMLDEVKESIINAYEIKTGLSRNKISKLMSQESWMNAKKAQELGFVDGILQREEAGTNDISDEDSSQLFTPVTVTNSLKEKIAKACHIEPKQAELTTKASDLMDRLDLMKTWR